MEGGPELRREEEQPLLTKIVDEAVYWRDANTRDRLATARDAASRALDNNGYRTRGRDRNTMFGRVMAALERRAVGDSPLLRPKAPTTRTANRPDAAPPAPTLPEPRPLTVSDEDREDEDRARRAIRTRELYRGAKAHEARMPPDTYRVVDDDEEAA